MINDVLYLLFEWLTIQHLETVVKSKIPGIQSLISKTVSDLETDLPRLGKPIASDVGVSVIYRLLFWILVDHI